MDIVKCSCGVEIKKKSLARHLKTNRHLKMTKLFEQVNKIDSESESENEIEIESESETFSSGEELIDVEEELEMVNETDDFTIEELDIVDDSIDKIVDEAIEKATKRKMNAYEKNYMMTLNRKDREKFKELFL